MEPKTTVLVLQHAECEPPAAYQEELEERGIATHVVELDGGESVPALKTFDALLVMGGPMSVNDEALFGWLTKEKRLIREFVDGGRPFWGVCLGAQLLAASLGARVYAGNRPEVGVLPVELAPGGALDPIFVTLPKRFMALQWHSDTFELPEDSVLLASSPAYVNQAFRWKRAYGLQFHLEVSPGIVREWGEIQAYADSLAAALGHDGGLPGVLAALVAEQDTMRSHAIALFRRWLDLDVVAGVRRTNHEFAARGRTV